MKKRLRTLLMHKVIEDGVQRPTEAVGGVFSREAIAARAESGGPTILRGEIRLRKTLADKLEENWWQVFVGNAVRLGTSRKDDYGLADLTVWSKQEKEADQL